jgi:hypothetical protein
MFQNIPDFQGENLPISQITRIARVIRRFLPVFCSPRGLFPSVNNSRESKNLRTKTRVIIGEKCLCNFLIKFFLAATIRGSKMRSFPH